MKQTECEEVLSRVLAYVAGTGIAIDRQISIAALELVEDALAHDGAQNLYAYVMKRLPQQFALPPVNLPPLSPAINRGSIGYRPG